MMLPSDLSTAEARIFELRHHQIMAKTDKLFGWLMLFQWVLAVGIAVGTTPWSWAGDVARVHPHVWYALVGGGILSLYPFWLIRREPGADLNRYVVCVSQMCYSMLLIHLTGGRIETHFHIFGSLAFLAFYLDYKVVLLATVITGLDHLLRGMLLPQSIYGVAEASVLQALEHAAWVIFEDVFLVLSIHGGLHALKETSRREHSLEATLANIENTLAERTRELFEIQHKVTYQQMTLANSARLSSLGEMAAGIAHEINNPLAIISGTSMVIRKRQQKGTLTDERLAEALNDIDKTVLRISRIIKGLRNISRDASDEECAEVALADVFSEVLAVCAEKFRNNQVELRLDLADEERPVVKGRRVQLSQVVLNLLSNAFDAVEKLEGARWVELKVELDEAEPVITVRDSGPGIPAHLQEKIFQPFFSTKDVGKGTGLGLSLSKAIVEKHGGALGLETVGGHTQFTVRLPLKSSLRAA